MFLETKCLLHFAKSKSFFILFLNNLKKISIYKGQGSIYYEQSEMENS